MTMTAVIAFSWAPLPLGLRHSFTENEARNLKHFLKASDCPSSTHPYSSNQATAFCLSATPSLLPLYLPPSLSLWLKTESFPNSSGISLPQYQARQSQSFVFPVILYQPRDMLYKPKLQATQFRPLFGGLM